MGKVILLYKIKELSSSDKLKLKKIFRNKLFKIIKNPSFSDYFYKRYPILTFLKNNEKIEKFNPIYCKKINADQILQDMISMNNYILENKISQLYCSNSVKFFKNKIANFLKLKEYTDKNAPVLFFGVYRNCKKESNIYNKHTGKAIYLLGGSDISPYISNYKKNYKVNIRYFKKIDKTKNKIITISKFQSDLLKKHNIPHENINIGWTINLNMHPIPKGKSIYIYANKYNHQYYGSLIYEEVYKKLHNKYNFIIAGAKNDESKNNNFTEKHIKYYLNPFDAYKQCFIGLRLVPFDGNANTVKEMGLCGIKVIHNGNDKNCIPWKFNSILFNKKIPLTDPNKELALKNAVDDIIISIEEESKTIGQIDNILADKVKKNISFNDDFLYSLI